MSRENWITLAVLALGLAVSYGSLQFQISDEHYENEKQYDNFNELLRSHVALSNEVYELKGRFREHRHSEKIIER